MNIVLFIARAEMCTEIYMHYTNVTKFGNRNIKNYSLNILSYSEISYLFVKNFGNDVMICVKMYIMTEVYLRLSVNIYYISQEPLSLPLIT